MQSSIRYIWSKIIKFPVYLRNIITKRVEDFGAQYIAFGIFGVLNYPIFYLIWVYYNSRTYENLGLRVTATILCLLLLIKDYWPKKFKPWLPLYWYFTLLFCLPFFFFFMLFKNGTDVWLMSSNTIVFWLLLMVDWISYVFILIIGCLLAFLAYTLSLGKFIINLDVWWGVISQFLASFIVVAFFTQKKFSFDNQKLQTIKTIGASIAHELRTPLRTIASAASGIKNYLPILMDSYKLAKEEKLPIKTIPASHYKTLLSACDYIEAETQAAFTVINMLLVNVNQTFMTSMENSKLCSINECINEAIRRYPFDIGERDKVHYQEQSDFYFRGDEILVVHILFNLFKNALFYIKAAGKGEIWIWLEYGTKLNKLHFKDTGAGIPTKVLPHIFSRFYSRTPHGTGIGLTFCKVVMLGLNGDIICKSKEGEFTEFILSFPIDPTMKPIDTLQKS